MSVKGHLLDSVWWNERVVHLRRPLSYVLPDHTRTCATPTHRITQNYKHIHRFTHRVLRCLLYLRKNIYVQCDLWKDTNSHCVWHYRVSVVTGPGVCEDLFCFSIFLLQFIVVNVMSSRQMTTCPRCGVKMSRELSNALCVTIWINRHLVTGLIVDSQLVRLHKGFNESNTKSKIGNSVLLI